MMTLKDNRALKYGWRAVLLCAAMGISAASLADEARIQYFNAQAGNVLAVLSSPMQGGFEWNGQSLGTKDIRSLAAIRFGALSQLNSQAPVVRLAAAQAYMDQGDYAQAQQMLAGVERGQSDESRASHQYLQAMLQIKQGKAELAGEMYSDWSGKHPIRAYLAMNIAIVYAEKNQLDAAEYWLKETVALELPATEEWLALKDRAYVLLGSVYNWKGQPALARKSLEKVRLDGVDAKRALLGLGWTDAARGQNKEALAPWSYLSSLNKSDASVQESYLLVPFALTRLNAHGKASNTLSKAIRIYDQETAALKSAVNQAKAKQLFQGVDRAYLAGDVDRMAALQQGLGTSVAAYTATALKQPSVYKNYAAYMDLLDMQRQALQWKRGGANVNQGGMAQALSKVKRLKAAYAKRLNADMLQAYQKQMTRLSEYKSHANFSLAESFERVANQEGVR